MTDLLDDISVVPQPSEERLTERQFVDYCFQREDCLEWLLTFGKKPKRAEGYAHGTVKARAHRMDQFYLWVWDEEGGYTANISPRTRRRLAPPPRQAGQVERPQGQLPEGRHDVVQVAPT